MSDVLDELRQLLLGDLYNECRSNPNGVSRDRLEEQVRLLQEQGCVGDCTVDNVVSLCKLNMKTKSIDSCGLGCSSLSCPICTEPFTPSNPAVRLCTAQPKKHCFHSACINQWISQNPRNPKCPECRSPLVRASASVPQARPLVSQAQPLQDQARQARQARDAARNEYPGLNRRDQLALYNYFSNAHSLMRTAQYTMFDYNLLRHFMDGFNESQLAYLRDLDEGINMLPIYQCLTRIIQLVTSDSLDPALREEVERLIELLLVRDIEDPYTVAKNYLYNLYEQRLISDRLDVSHLLSIVERLRPQ